MSKLKLGKYKHSKTGNFYRVITIAKHSETKEDLVVYECLYDNPLSKIWVRPLTMFIENVTINGKIVPRFSYCEDKGHFEAYIYKINKIYSLDEEGTETEVDFKLKSGFIYLPNRPEFTSWRSKDTIIFLEEIYNFHEDIPRKIFFIKQIVNSAEFLKLRIFGKCPTK